MVGLMTESEFVRHMPCSNCGSSDGNSLYSDGHTYCFVCHDRTGGDNDVIHSQHVSKTVQLTGSAERLHKRKISEKTCQFYQILRDVDVLRFPYYDESGSTPIGNYIIGPGDCSITLLGGHTYKAIGEVKVYEFKTGPYKGQKLDKRFIDD